MGITGDLRKREFRGRSWIYGEIRKGEIIPATELILHPEPPAEREGRVILLHRNTIKKMRRINAWRRGYWLVTIGYDRPDRRK